jgi:hypothetical protein
VRLALVDPTTGAVEAVETLEAWREALADRPDALAALERAWADRAAVPLDGHLLCLVPDDELDARLLRLVVELRTEPPRHVAAGSTNRYGVTP